MQLDVRELTKIYEEQRGLQPTSFSINEGEFVAIVGHNGAGKSTLLKMLAGWVIPDSGQVSVGGTDLLDRRALVRAIGFIPETPNLFENFSVEYNLKLFGRLFQVGPSRIEEILTEFGLVPFRHDMVQVLSKGLKQRVSIGRSLLPDPSIILFDEPTAGLDFEMTKEIYRLMKRVHASRKTVLFTSHRPEEIKTLATRIVVLHNGGVVFDGAPEKYFASKSYEELYL